MFSNDFKEDLKRYPKRAFLKEQSVWSIALYRLARSVNQRGESLLNSLFNIVYWPLFRLVETITGVSLPKDAQIGPGLRIWHFGNIFVNSKSIIGENCTLRQGVTIGNRHEDGPAPVIGNNVNFGAYAQVLGNIKIGNNVNIGAMSVVLIDVPDNSTVAGVPAKIVKSVSNPA
ncbi:serine acetyltransferase [Methylophilus sp. DW102]|uniref:serine O-acetyltransferase n=1 Tax=Methylophilus sp. DW102 TaxID=3095607 RepID=UPI003085B33B|nr:serine acetyltransferase [Methylophilus sp. DW102]